MVADVLTQKDREMILGYEGKESEQSVITNTEPARLMCDIVNCIEYTSEFRIERTHNVEKMDSLKRKPKKQLRS